VGTQTHEWGEVQELRNCVCRTTLVLVLEKGEDQVPEPGARWLNRKHQRVAIITQLVTVKRGMLPFVEYRYASSERRHRLSLRGFYQTFTPET
jgi:hypothetical protein